MFTMKIFHCRKMYIMKRYNVLLICLVVLLLILGSGCSSNSSSSSSAATTANGSSATTLAGGTTQKVFTLAELNKFDGKNGNPAYVAINGIVYDVTNAKGWSNGTHKNGVTAGKDLSKEINNSPHGTSVLSGLAVVGTLKG